MNRMIRSLRSTLGAAVILCAFAGALQSDTSVAFDRQEFGDAKHRKPDPSQYTFTQIDVPGATLTLATAINNRDQIVGTYVDASGAQHGFLLDDGVLTVIDVPNAAQTNLIDINNRGQIVGHYVADLRRNGFLLSNGVFTRLTVPGVFLDSIALGINDQGRIVGAFR